MRMESAGFYERVARVLLYALIALLPVFFLPVSLDPLEVNKQTLLVFLTLCASLAWIGSMVVGRSLSFRRGWINLLPGVMLLLAVVSALLSKGSYLSWIGPSSQEYVSVLSMFAYAALFYLSANLLDTPGRQRVAFACLLVSGAVTGLFGLLPMLGLPALVLPDGTLPNTIGTMNAFAMFMAVLTVAVNGLFLVHRESDGLLYRGWRGTAQHVLLFLVSGIAFFALLILDDRSVWIAFLGGLAALMALAIVRAKDFEGTNRFLLPFFLIVAALPFLFWLNSPFTSKLPVEVTPNTSASWKVAKKTLADTSVLFGSGEGTYGYDFAQNRPISVNSTAFWSTRFDRASSFALTVLPTSGVLGALAWVLFVLATLGLAARELIRGRVREQWLPVFVAAPAFAALVLGLLLYSGNLTALSLLFLLAGVIGSQAMKRTLTRSFAQSPRLALLFALLFVLLATGIVTVIFVTTQRYLGEVAYASAMRLDRANAPIKDVVAKLDRAATFNRYDDVYYRNLSQAFLAEVGQEIGKTTAPEDMTADKRAYIQALTGAAVNASVHATDLAPNNVLNWMARGAVYREFIPLIGNAGDFSVSAYEKAAALDPVSPEVPNELGKTYFALAENNRTLTAAKDKKVADEATATVNGFLKKAEEQFDRAVELKADYAPAHYQLGLVYERQGKITEAVGKMESVAKYNPLDVGVFFQLGLLYLRRGDKGDVDRAQDAFEKAIALSPSYANARWFLASIYEQKHDIPKAIEQVQKVLDANPDNQLVKARLERLKSGKTDAALPPAVQ